MTFALFARFLGEGNHTSQVLTSSKMQEFAIWLQETPVNEHYGSTKRSVHGTHAHLRDMRALANEELIAPVKVTFPKLPQRLFPVLSDEELDKVWWNKYLTGDSELSIRNRRGVCAREPRRCWFCNQPIVGKAESHHVKPKRYFRKGSDHRKGNIV